MAAAILTNRPHHFPRSTTSHFTPIMEINIPLLRAAIQAVEAKILILTQEREVLSQRLSSAVKVQSPIHRLPDELLARCFAMGVHSNDTPSETFPADSEDPIYISRVLLVCKHWNQLACSTPSLWSTIVVSNTHSISKAQRQLVRSKAVPLDITLSFSPRLNGSAAGEPVMRAMELLTPSIYRWRTFRMQVPNRVHACTALKLCTRSRAPILEALSVQISNSILDDHYISPPRNLFQGSTPRLATCDLNAFNYDWDQGLLKDLKVLKLAGYWNSHSPTGLQLRAVMEACPLLEELHFKNLTDIDPDCDDLAKPGARPLPLLTLPRLHTISFYYSGVTRATVFLEQTSFPALQNLELGFLDNISPILQALERQAVSVKTHMNLPVGLPLDTLRVESCFFGELKLLSLLKRVPSLSSLTLVDVEDLSGSFLMGLATPPKAQHWLIPQLEHLSLEGCSASSVDWSNLSRLVESRIPSQTMHRHHTARSYASVSASIRKNGEFFGGDLGPPRRLRSLDLTRCNQFSREQLQWFRMYVHDVRSDGAKGAWGTC